MKKLLPILGFALLASGTTAMTIDPADYPGMRLTGISANGVWAAGSDENAGTFVIVNLETEEEYWYTPEEGENAVYSSGLGKFVSDNGIVVASSQTFETACYWEDGDWHTLPIKDTDYAAYPNAITPDGSRITGSVSKTAISLDANEIMNVPVVWNRNADGEYDMYVEIPHPKTDWTGRMPQYVLIDDISADGKKLAGDIVDCSGFIQQPVVFVEGEDGEWTYQLLHPELLNPDAVEFPPYPGEAPEKPEVTQFMTPENAEAYKAAMEEWMWRPVPEQTDFMTDEELDAFFAALDAYYEDWETNPYPFMEDFMTEEEIAAYNSALNAYYEVPEPDPMDYMTEADYKDYEQAVAAWEVVFEEWAVAYAAFDEVFWDAVVNPAAPTFVMNSAMISANGRYYVMGTEAYYVDPTSPMGISYASTPMLFDLENDTYTLLNDGVKDILATMVMDNGAVLGGTSSDNYTRSAAISQKAGEPFVMLDEIIKANSPEIYSWMVSTMTHDIVSYDYVLNEETGEYEEVITIGEQMITGTPVATSDLKTIATWTFNNWDEYADTYFSYIFPSSIEVDGISNAIADRNGDDITIDHKGMLTINADVTNVAIYDINGRLVYRQSDLSTTAKTGLQSGIYIIRATTADGRTIVKKAAI